MRNNECIVGYARYAEVIGMQPVIRIGHEVRGTERPSHPEAGNGTRNLRLVHSANRKEMPVPRVIDVRDPWNVQLLGAPVSGNMPKHRERPRIDDIERALPVKTLGFFDRCAYPSRERASLKAHRHAQRLNTVLVGRDWKIDNVIANVLP